MAIPLRSLTAGRYVRLEDLKGFPIKLTEVSARTSLGPLPNARGIYVNLRDSRWNISDNGPTADETVLSSLIFIGTEVTDVGRYVRVEDLGSYPLDLRAVRERTALGPLPKTPGIYVNLSKAFEGAALEGYLPDDTAVLSALVHVGTGVTEVGRYARASRVWDVIPRLPQDATQIRARTPFRARPTSPGVYVNFNHPTLSSCLSKLSNRLPGRFGFIFVEAALIASLTVVGVRKASKLGRFALLDKASRTFPFTVLQAEKNLMSHVRSTPLSHLPTAAGTYLNLADKRLFRVLRREWDSMSRNRMREREEDRVRRVEEAMIDASFLVPDRRLFLVATWLKERDWMLGRLREDEFRYLLEWISAPGWPLLCKRIGCPCARRSRMR